MRVSRALIVCVAALSCSDIDTGPNVAASLEFTALPFPAVVAQDSLRDTSGIAAPLRAHAFNSDNEEIIDAPVRFAALDPLVTVDSVTGVVLGGSVADTTARIVAFIGNLQSAPLRLSVVPQPDSVAPSGTIDTLRYSVIDSTLNVSGDLAVRVLSRAAGSVAPVRDWIVTFALQVPADSTRARIEGENRRRSTADTTSSTGVASRRIRLFPAGLASARDSIVVLARVQYRGAQIAGSPLRLVLPVQPRTP